MGNWLNGNGRRLYHSDFSKWRGLGIGINSNHVRSDLKGILKNLLLNWGRHFFESRRGQAHVSFEKLSQSRVGQNAFYIEFLERRLFASVSTLLDPPADEIAQGSDSMATIQFINATDASPDPVLAINQYDFTIQSNKSGPLILADVFRNDNRFSGIDGTGFTTVILDSGIDLDDPFFGPDTNGDGISDRIVFTRDFTGSENTNDFLGHGTNVSSIVASSDSIYTGIAPGVDIIHLKVINDNGNGTFSILESALDWVVDHVSTYNIASVNLSLGDGGNYTTYQNRYGISDELAALAAMDVIVVAAAGNSFFDNGSIPGVNYPAADVNTIAVGAVFDTDLGSSSQYSGGAKAFSTGADRLTPFTQRHLTLVDVFAPGAAITGAGPGAALTTMHGTSQAAPHVTGAAVLAQQLAVEHLGRRLTIGEFRELLESTSITIHDGDDENDNVINTGQDYKRIDLVSLGLGILAIAQEPEIVVTHGGQDIQAGTNKVDFGNTALGTIVTKTFTVFNQGYGSLLLDPNSFVLPTGFTVSTGFGTTTLAANQSTTFSIQLDALATGDYSGNLFFTNNDLDEGSFDILLNGSVHPIQLVDQIDDRPDRSPTDMLPIIPGQAQFYFSPRPASKVSQSIPNVQWSWAFRGQTTGVDGILSTLNNAADQGNGLLNDFSDRTHRVITDIGDNPVVQRVQGNPDTHASTDLAEQV